MKYTMQLAKNLSDLDVIQHGCDDAVLRFKVPYLVSTIYKEHVDGWYVLSAMTPEAQEAWKVAVQWLRSLEKGITPRLFAQEADKRLEPRWWDIQVKTLVSRRPTASRRMCLPLEDEIELCIRAMQPHLIVWLLELVDERRMDMQMFPKHLLQKTYTSLSKLTPMEFDAQIQRCYDLYPELPHNSITRRALQQTYFPPHMSHWPGLRLCVPFFFDMAVLQPAPSNTVSRQGKYVVLHSYLDTSYARTSRRDAQTALIDELVVQLEPYAHSIGLDVTPENAATILTALESLEGMHPRSFRPNDPLSPYGNASKVLMPYTTTTAAGRGNIVKLPEHALDSCEVGFSFTYMKPRIFSSDKCPKWDKEEDFYEVKFMDDKDEPRYFHISPYTGFGLRLRHTLLSIVDTTELKGQGVCLVLPDGLAMETTENIMLTAIGWLQGLGLTDVKLLSEGVCHAMALGSIGAIVQRDTPTTWASFHDGAFVSQVLGVTVKHHEKLIQDQWNDAYRVSPLKRIFMENLRDAIFDQPNVHEIMEGFTENRFLHRTWMIESIKNQLPRILLEMEQAFAVVEKTNIDITIHFTNTKPITVTFSKTAYDTWLGQCFQEWTDKPWWPKLKEDLETCTGVVVSGGIFECCPKSAVQVLTSLLDKRTKKCTKKSRLDILHGACLAIYEEQKCQHVVWDDTPLPILKMEKHAKLG